MAGYAYYNETNKFKVAWLRELISVGAIAEGVVDDRSIEAVEPSDLDGFTQCHFFAGVGVWSYALRIAGWRDDRPVWTGSCPCQPFSIAGKEEGFSDPRHYWPAWFRLARKHRPVTIFGEQVERAISLHWLDLVSTDLEGEGYAVGSSVFGSHSVGAPHKRQRLYFVADADRGRRKQYGGASRQRSAREGKRSAGLNVVATWAERAPADIATPLSELAGWVTPAARDWKDTIGMSITGTNPDGSVRSRLDQLPRQASLVVSGPTQNGSNAPTGKPAQLNPALSRWLMGLSRVWDVCAVTAMQSMPKPQRRSSRHTAK